MDEIKCYLLFPSLQRAVDIIFMAFVMVSASTMVRQWKIRSILKCLHISLPSLSHCPATTQILIPFMLYGLDMRSSGWTAANVALFGACIASTDAAAVSAVLSAGLCLKPFESPEPV